MKPPKDIVKVIVTIVFILEMLYYKIWLFYYNVLLQDMVGGLVEHISDQNINFDLVDLMNQTVSLKVREGCQNVPLWL